MICAGSGRRTCVALLLDLCEGPAAMLTLDEDCVSVVFPPSAADSPEMTRPLEKLRFPNSRLSVDEDEDTWTEGAGVAATLKREETGQRRRAHLAGALLLLLLLLLGRLELRADPAGARQAGDLGREQLLSRAGRLLVGTRDYLGKDGGYGRVKGQLAVGQALDEPVGGARVQDGP